MNEITDLPPRKITTPCRYSCYEQLASSDEDIQNDSPKRRRKKQKEKTDDTRQNNSEITDLTLFENPLNSNSCDENKKFGSTAFICQQCGKVLRSQATLLRHQISHTGLKPFACTICKQCFSSSVALKEHKALHENKKLYECHLCTKRFRQNSCYRRHLLTHSKKYNIICSVCNRCFLSKDYLRSHMKIHSDEKRYSCGQCNKAFARHSDLNRHKILHTGNRPYMCHVCGISFADSSSCRRHVKDHDSSTKLQNYTCDHCGSSFRKAHLLSQHLLKKHKLKNSDAVGTTTKSLISSSEHDFNNENLLLTDGLLHCPDLSESNICETLSQDKESLNEIEGCTEYLESGNYNNLLSISSASAVFKDISAEVEISNYKVRFYPEVQPILKSKSQVMLTEEFISTELRTDYIVCPDFNNQDYYKWLEDFVTLAKMLPYPIEADLFNKIGQVHKTVSDVLADPSNFLFCKSTFAKLRLVCQDLEQVKNAHLDYIFQQLQD